MRGNHPVRGIVQKIPKEVAYAMNAHHIWLENAQIAVVGLGYVGLPLAVEFGKSFQVIGFDINRARIEALRAGRDETRETTPGELAAACQLTFASNPKAIAECNIYIITVPTPIDKTKRPDLSALIGATETVGRVLKAGDTVIYESTVYPGCSEEDCVPVLERISGLVFNEDFTIGYSPERINPGDREHRLPTIVKVTSGSTPEAAERIDLLYASIVMAGTHRAESIKVAEAAKVIENTQRDINIALVNELAKIFNRLEIDTESVLRAAGTKWNFLPFKPGLVGGHCIGVDPYYLTHKAEVAGFHPEIILAGRRINDGMGKYVASRLIKTMINKGIAIKGARILVLGLTFKENCPDLRNTRVIDVINELRDFGVEVDVHDPWADADEARAMYELEIIDMPSDGSYDGVLIAVAHDSFADVGQQTFDRLCKNNHVLYDLKGVVADMNNKLKL